MNTWELLDEFITRNRLELPQKAAFWPSMASVVLTDADGFSWVEGKCMRAAFFSYALQAKSPLAPNQEQLIKPSAYSRWIWEIGKYVERMVVEQFKRAGLWMGNSIKYYDEEHHISGEIDSICYDPEEETQYLAEIKSTHGYFAKKEIYGTKNQPGFPRWSNLLQLSLYLDYLRDHKDIYPYGKLMYIDRGDVDRCEYKVAIIGDKDTPEEERYISVESMKIKNFTMKDVYDRYRVLNDYLEAGRVPPNDYVIRYSDEQIEALYERGKLGKTKYNAWKKKGEHPGGCWQCSPLYCAFSGICWPEGK